MYILLCHARIIYVHSTSFEMARACIHLGFHQHHMSNGTCHESLDVAYQCVVNEVMKMLVARNSTIVIAMSKQFLVDHLLKSSANGEGHHL